MNGRICKVFKQKRAKKKYAFAASPFDFWEFKVPKRFPRSLQDGCSARSQKMRPMTSGDQQRLAAFSKFEVCWDRKRITSVMSKEKCDEMCKVISVKHNTAIVQCSTALGGSSCTIDTRCQRHTGDSGSMDLDSPGRQLIVDRVCREWLPSFFSAMI